MTEVLHNLVQSTRDYTLFNTLASNRYINKSHVKNLVREMEENGNFTESVPIIVNGKYEVVDGQHRLLACKELGFPVYFTVIQDLGVHSARRMNIVQRGWVSQDFLNSYADEGRTPYVKMRELAEEYPQFSITVLMLYVNGGYVNSKGYLASFRGGQLGDFDMDGARQRLDHLDELTRYFQGFREKAMAIAVLELMRSEYYEPERMLDKVQRKAASLKNFTSYIENMRQLEDLYNDHARVSRVRLY